MKAQAGLGVIELMVGLGLVAVAIMGLNCLVVSAIRSNLSAQLIDQATRLAQQKIEQVKYGGYAAAVPGTVTETQLSDAGNTGGGFQRKTVITDETGLAKTRKVSVTLTWTDYGTRQTSFSTEITQ